MPRENAADLAGSDDTHGASVQIGAEKSIQFEIPVPCPVIGAVNFATECQDQRYGMLGD